MRIIAGQFRGRKLLAPDFDTTRPITDRVKQSLFDMIAGDLPDAVVYDCFSGTGSMGLESLSRGATPRPLLRGRPLRPRPAQEEHRHPPGRTPVPRHRRRSVQVVRPYPRRRQDARPTVIFLDPPYRFITQRGDELRTLVMRMAEQHLAPGGYIILRHDAHDQFALPAGTEEFDRREYGGMVLRFLRRSPQDSSVTPPPQPG